MRAEGSGWVLWQPSDDEDEAVCLSLVNQSRWVQRTFTQPEAQKLYAALGDALGNMQPQVAVMSLSADPSDEDLREGAAHIQAGGALIQSLDSDVDYTIAIVRYLNGLGPDPTSEQGEAAYKRVGDALGNMTPEEKQ